MEIFTQEGFAFLSRWGHFLAGITWIGLLYYFNFVQTPAFAQFEAGPRTEAVSKLVPRALWWFRWGAALTLLTGLMILGFNEQFDGDYFASAQGTSILTGSLLAIVMFTNVWAVIWPNQKIVIASAQRVAAGGEADPAAATSQRKGALASRTNTLLSIPMLFFMGATSHLVPASDYSPDAGSRTTYWIIVVVLLGLLELNALGRLGGYGPGPIRKYMDSHRDTIIVGFGLWIVLYLLWEILF